MNLENTALSALIIGTGSIGERHLRCFQSSGLYSVAACESDTERGNAIATKYDCPIFGSLEEALAQNPFDVAVICTPANFHTPVALACLAKDLHVLIEKPLALSLEGLAELEALAVERKRVVRVAYTSRSVPAFQALKDILASGKIGDPRQVSFVSGQDFPKARPAYASIYYNRHETGGGAIQDGITHHLHAVEWLVSPIRRLFAHAARQVLAGVEVEDTVNLTAVLEDQTLVNFSFNQFQAPNETTIQINGTLGSARIELHNQRLGTFLYGDTSWTWINQPVEERDAAFVRQATYFRSEIAGKHTPLSSLAEGIQTLKANCAALESAQTHREITIR